jgi:hypothetical protein
MNNQHAAEAIQLEAREEAIKFALAAMDTALQKLNHESPLTLTLQDLIDAKLAINEAVEQLEGRATP